MKNLPLIIGVIAVLAVAAGGYFFMQNRSGVPLPGSNNTATNTGPMSLKDLMNIGQNQVCTFSYAGDSGTTEGTSYIASDRVRTDFTGSDAEGVAYDGGMIMDAEYIYTWSSQQPEGIKMPVTTIDNGVTDESGDPTDESYDQAPVDPDEKYDYSCRAWNIDNNVFTPPSNITFIDMTEQMQQYEQLMQQNTESSTMDATDMQNACSSCDSLTGDAAAACRQALGC